MKRSFGENSLWRPQREYELINFEKLRFSIISSSNLDLFFDVKVLVSVYVNALGSDTVESQVILVILTNGIKEIIIYLTIGIWI